MEGQTDGWMDGQTNGMDKNYIPLQHTSSAMGIIGGCLYKQTEKYYFIVVSQILTSSPALGHDPGVHTRRMEENPPRYPHTKYEKFLISGCRVISNQKTSK